MERLVFHVDVNSAFLSWEAVRRVRAGLPDLREVPSAIGGSERRSVILAKSIPAKAFGIQTGEPVAAALQKCPDLQLAPPDFSLYHQCSRDFAAICRSYAPAVEQFSIDECFLDMSRTGYLYPNPLQTAAEIKDKIHKQLGFTVNVGVSINKLLAKMASDFEKPDKVHTLFPHELPAKLWKLPVEALLSVGEATAAKLRRAEIFTIGELAKADPVWLQQLLGNKLGASLHQYANGIDPSPVQEIPEEAKGYSHAITLQEDIRSRDAALQVLLSLCDTAAARMRADGGQAFCVTVTIRSSDFKDKSHQRRFSEPTDITGEIFAAARSLFDELWDGSTPLRLLGAGLSDITRDAAEQLSFFSDGRRERAMQLDRAVDQVRRRFGKESVMRCGVIGKTTCERKT